MTFPLRRLRFVLIAAVAGVAGCAALDQRAPSLIPTRSRVDAGPFAVYSNMPLAADSAQVAELMDLRAHLDETLGLPEAVAADRPIEVYILDDKNTFRHFLTFYYPELPPRRAFFFAQGDRRVVYAYQGDRLEEDLRHEATHALLNARVADLPLWLDEGLAEYFETGRTNAGRNVDHLSKLPSDMAGGKWRPDLARLEAMTDVREMTPRDYRESWAWVHYLLTTSDTTRSALIGYLNDLRDGIQRDPLSARLAKIGVNEPQLVLDHVESLTESKLATTRQARRAVVRMQNTPVRQLPPTTTTVVHPPQRTILGRLVDTLGRLLP